MRFKSAYDFKEEIVDDTIRGAISGPYGVGIGISPTGRHGDYKVAVRARDSRGLSAAVIDEITKRSAGEIDIRETGEITTTSALAPASVTNTRQLTLGSSVAHYRGTAGTLGFFARRLADGAIGFVSANSVIAAQDLGREGDEILSPGPADSGTRRDNVVAHLDGGYSRLSAKNPLDCAFGILSNSTTYEPSAGPAGKLSTQGFRMEDGQLLVSKIGRTTGLTLGEITAFDLTLKIEYSFGMATFQDLIEISTRGNSKFCRGGDSGALVFTEDLRPVGLIFAATGNGVAYAHPFKSVVTRLGVALIA